MNPKSIPSLLSAICALSFTTLASATTIAPPSFKSLVAQADYVVRAVVKAVQSEWRENPATPGERYIGTRVELEVLEVIAGEPPTPLFLDLVGGQVGDDTLAIEGAPSFKKDDEAILFIRGNGQLIVPLVAMQHGFYRVVRDQHSPAGKVLRANGSGLFNTEEVALPLAAISGTALINPSARPLSSTDFSARIRQVRATATQPTNSHEKLQ